MIAVIGAGPAGGYVAYLLAKKGMDVHIYEEHPEVGCPVSCTGILTGSLENFHEIFSRRQKYLVNTIEKIRVYAPNKDYAEIKATEYIVNRTRFDSTIVNMAVEAGARLHLSHRFIDHKGGLLTFKNMKSGKTVKTKAAILIGADGVNSVVAKLINPDFSLIKKNNYYMAPQARVKTTCDPNRYDVYLGSSFPAFFGWVVPENKHCARIGLAGFRNVGDHFHEFLKEMHINKRDIIEYQGGMFPVFISYLKVADVREKNAIFLVGDAASQIKSTTGGGIIPGLKSASLLAEAITNKKEYEHLLSKYVNHELLRHRIIRKALNCFSDADYNYLIRLMKSRRVLNVLNKYNRDESKKLLMALLLVEPRFMYFTKVLPILFKK